MWQGRLLELLGIWLIVAAFGNFGTATNGWINMATGLAVAVVGMFLRKLRPRLGPAIAVLGVTLVLLSFVHPFMVEFRQVWIDGVAGFVIWFFGWRTVAAESGGPWRLKDRPIL